MTTHLLRRSTTRTRLLAALVLFAAGLLPLLAPSAHRAAAAPNPTGHPGMGFLSNMDVYNETGTTCEGFDIQIEGVTSTDVAGTYWGSYGQPSVTDTTVNGAPGIDVRWAATYGAGWSWTTPPGVSEHFGVSIYNVTPGNQHLTWLCEDPANPGTLIPTGGTAVGNGYTNNTLPANPVPSVVQAVLPTPSGEVVQAQFQNPAPAQAPAGSTDAVWYYKYQVSSANQLALTDLTPADGAIMPSQMNASQINNNLDLVDGGQSWTVDGGVNSGDAGSVWVVQEYAYTSPDGSTKGPYDDAHTASCSDSVPSTDPNNCANFLGPLLSTTLMDTNLANNGYRAPINVNEQTDGKSSKVGGSVASNDLTGVNANPGNIDCGSTCTTVVDQGSSVTLTASPKPGYAFAGWSGACTNTAGSCTVNASQRRDVTAKFTTLTYVSAPTVVPVAVAGSSVNLTIKGGGFHTGVVASFPGSGITVTSQTLTNSKSGSTLKVTAQLSSTATAGLRDVVITNTDTSSATCSGCVNVHALPRISSVSPSSLGRPSHGSTSTLVTLTGSGFQTGAKVAIPGLSVVGAANVTSSTSITITVKVTSAASTGPKTITVTNPDKGAGTASISVS